MFWRKVLSYLFCIGWWFACGGLTSAEEVLSKEKRSPRIGLVLSGGGARGLAHIGVLKVIEESGIRVDYVVGTSMGAIVGALYAIGYSAVELEKIATEANWQEMFTDELSRRELPIEDKDRDGRYIHTFPVIDKQVRLPTGLIAGQRLLRFLSSLTWSAASESDFSQFPIPFACLATNLEDGSPVVFHKGNLHEVIRASMSLPSIFVPVNYDEKLLVDGMLVRNFPVQEAVELGAELIIGVDVGAGLYKAEELTGLLRVVDQSVSFRSADTIEKQRKLCEVLILPELGHLSAMSFDSAAELIKKGEEAGRVHVSHLRQLSYLQNLQGWHFNRDKQQNLKNTEYLVTSIKIQGLEKADPSLVFNKLGLDTPLLLDIKELLEAIDRVYSTQFFETVTYDIQDRDDETILVIKVKEKSEDSFSFGLRYTTDQEAAVLLNLTLRNYAWSSSKVTLDLKLSSRPEVELRHLSFSGLTRRSGFLLRLSYRDREPFYYSDMGVKNGRFRSEKTEIEGLLGSKTSDSFFMGVGLRRDISRISNSPLAINVRELRSAGQNVLFGVLQVDTLDDTYFPRRGDYFKGLLEKYHNDLLKETLFTRYTAVWQKASPIGRRRSLLTGLKLGYISGTDVPYGSRLRFGQYSDFHEIAFFPSIWSCERGGYYLQAFMIGVQFELDRHKFLIFGLERGGAFDTQPKFFTDKNNEDYVSAALGLKTPVGPVLMRIAYCDREKYNFQASLGYRF